MTRKPRNLLVGSSLIILIAFLVFGSSVFLPSCKKPPETENEYRIGCMLPLSDVPSHQYGIWARQGIDLATEQINSKGGIGGKKLVIDYQDDLGNGDQAVKVMNKFTSVNKYPIVFAYISQPSAAVAPIARDSKTVLITNTYTPGITQGNDYVFRVGHNAGTDSRAMAQFLKKQFGDASLAILYVKTPAGDKATEILEQAYRDVGGRVVGAISYAVDEKDFRSLLLKIKSLKPQIIYIYPYKEVGTIVREIRRLNIDSVLATNNTVEQPNFFNDAGEAAEGVIFTTPLFDSESRDAVMASYFDSFKRKYPNIQSEVSAATWFDTVNIVALAIERGGYTAEGIRGALLQIKNYPGVAGMVTFREDRDVDKPVIVKVVRKGHFVSWDAK
jgi:branched-chain amino acid transport system substrate-binding protein